MDGQVGFVIGAGSGSNWFSLVVVAGDVSTGRVVSFDSNGSSANFMLMSCFASSILVVSGKHGRLTSVQLDWLSPRIPTTSSSLSETTVQGEGSFLKGFGFGSGDNSSGLHLISLNLLFPR